MAGKVVERLVFSVTADAVRETCVIEGGQSPIFGIVAIRALSLIVEFRRTGRVTGHTVVKARMIKRDLFPIVGHMTS